MSRTISLSLLVCGFALAAAACNNDAFCYTCGSGNEDAGGDAGGAGGDGGSSGTGGTFLFDGGETGGSVPSDGGSEDACTADIQNDPLNCGACGHVCDLPGAFPKCVAGQCVIDSCAPGRVDLNQTASDGCEYVCTESNNKVEICDGLDNDCNGVKDDGFDLTSDPNNCGLCGNVCNLAHAKPKCEIVAGFPTCVVDHCDDGYADIDHLAQNGCEYACPVNPPVDEVCNDLDDDCDGRINDGDPGGGQPCASSCPGGQCLGQCTAGTTLCAGSELVCVPGVGPEIETCDGVDNDCDGVVDDGFDLNNDPNNCGACGHVCTLEHAVGGCQGGQCVIVTCLPGFASNDHDASNGCEYACPVTPPTVESCNGLDDDCNGVVDDAAALASQKPPQSGCYPKPGTPCAGADFVCMGADGWRCNYGAGVEVDAQGRLAVVETRCDGIDGNCNGQIDEAFADLDSACDNGAQGACRDSGKRVCDPHDDTKTICDLSFAPDPVPGAPSAEVCNGIDDDCNGIVDDGIVDDMVQVTAGGKTFYIDRYEASRPDATDTSAGVNEARRCVKAQVLPWTHASQAEAAAACAATGARLCTAEEFQAACEGGVGNLYPYGTTYQPTTCNGLDYDGIPGGANDNVLLPTGSLDLISCTTASGIHDLSGNAIEWTSTVTGNTGAPNNLPIYMAKGGSYTSPALGLTCSFSLSRFASNAILPELGFRCCKD